MRLVLSLSKQNIKFELLKLAWKVDERPRQNDCYSTEIPVLFCLQKEVVAAVFLLIKVVSKFDFGHFLDKRWKVEFGFPKSIVKKIHQYNK